MNIIVNAHARNTYDDLIAQLDNLKSIIKVNYKVEINIFDKMSKLPQWGMQTLTDGKMREKIIIITTTENIELLKKIVLSEIIIMIDIKKTHQEIAFEIARNLSSEYNPIIAKKSFIFFSAQEADTMSRMYITQERLSKYQLNTKYSIMRKLKLSNSHQLFIWWVLTNVLPKNFIKHEIFIKKPEQQI